MYVFWAVFKVAPPSWGYFEQLLSFKNSHKDSKAINLMWHARTAEDLPTARQKGIVQNNSVMTDINEQNQKTYEFFKSSPT